MRPRVVITHVAGQLANHLNLLAQFAALARELDLVVLDPSFGKYADAFESTRRSALCRYPVAPLPSPLRPPARARDKAFDWAVGLRDAVRFRQDLDPPPAWTRGLRTRVVEFGSPYVHMDAWTRADLPARALFVNGYLFRAKSLVAKHRPALVEFFRPIETHRRAAADATAAARGGQQGAALVGVHVRWGDYKTYRDGQFFYDLDVYKTLMRQARDALAPAPVRFLVCSADRIDAADFGDLPVGFGPGSSVGDLHALAGCDYVLGPPSSFSAWASFYGGPPLCHVHDPVRPLGRGDFEASPFPRTDWSEADA